MQKSANVNRLIFGKGILEEVVLDIVEGLYGGNVEFNFGNSRDVLVSDCKLGDLIVFIDDFFHYI